MSPAERMVLVAPVAASQAAGSTLPLPLRRSRRATRVATALIGAWSALLVVALSTLMAGHWATLPGADKADPVIQREIDALRAPGEEKRWLMVHVLYGECRCSQRLMDHLVERERPAGLVEKVILVGAEGEQADRLRAKGYAVQVVTRRGLSDRFHLGAAPLLLIAAPDGSLRYQGGYGDRKQGPDIADLTIL
ncbi:MAG: hypothetical protein ABI193_07610, partial [Minicystis sp.]